MVISFMNMPLVRLFMKNNAILAMQDDGIENCAISITFMFLNNLSIFSI